jgi:hypothetical protein
MRAVAPWIFRFLILSGLADDNDDFARPIDLYALRLHPRHGGCAQGARHISLLEYQLPSRHAESPKSKSARYMYRAGLFPKDRNFDFGM